MWLAFATAALALSIGTSVAAPQTITERDSCERHSSQPVPKFEVVRKRRMGLGPGLEIYVSSPQVEGSRDKLVELCCQLARNYAKEDALFAWILTNRRAAKRYNPQGEGNDQATASSFVAPCGFSRESGKGDNSVEWKPDPTHPEQLVHIDLGLPPDRP
jgi:hypothetical protein